MSLPRAVAVVLEGRRVLVIKRHLNGRDYAVLPGGGVEIGETVAVAALRELREETTLDAPQRPARRDPKTASELCHRDSAIGESDLAR